MSPRKPKVTVSFRADPDIVDEAYAKADERGEVLSEEIRKFLQRYIRRTK
jgi:antitoxin component of RelBE/YafQ-DinJ toxin-antitoxin module